MSYGDNKHFEHLKLPMTWAVMGIVGVVCVVAAILFLGDRREQVEPGAYANRTGFDATVKPLGSVLSFPVHKVGDGFDWLDDYFFAVRENRLLKKKVAELTQYRDLYTEMKDVNERYEKLLNLRTEPPVEMVAARSVSVSHGPFTSNRLIDAGSDHNISFGNPVITDQGLVGRVVGVSPRVSRVLMVTDINSHVPVMILRSDARAMMNGDGNTGYTKLDFVRGKDAVKVGDQVLTSGDGGIFPRGIPVGEAVHGVDGVWRVRLYTNRSAIDFVKVLLFKDFSQLPNAETLLRSPPISAILPPPQSVKADASAANATTGAAVSASSSSAASASVAKPAVAPQAPTAVKSASKPAVKPAGSASSPTLRPYTPSAVKPAGNTASSESNP